MPQAKSNEFPVNDLSCLSEERRKHVLSLDPSNKELKERRKVLRITRHAADAERERFLTEIFGSDIAIVTEDTPFGDDPVAAVKSALARWGKVVALEVIAPFPVLAKLVESRLGVPLVRAEFRRDESGRAIVAGKDESGRDRLAFSHYEELLRVSIESRPLQRKENLSTKPADEA